MYATRWVLQRDNTEGSVLTEGALVLSSVWESYILALGRLEAKLHFRLRACRRKGSVSIDEGPAELRLSPNRSSPPCRTSSGWRLIAQVIIMGILNNAGDKILLGRQKTWPKGELAPCPSEP